MLPSYHQTRRTIVAAVLALFTLAVVRADELTRYGPGPSGGGGGSNDCSGTGTIAYDAGSCQNGCGGFSVVQTILTWSHTNTGSNLVLFVEPYNLTGASLITVSSITYNSVSLTKLDSITATLEGFNEDSEIWYLINPSTGAHNIVVTFSGAADYSDAVAHSYTGVNQTSPINAHTIGQNTSGSGSFSQSATATGGNACWLAGFAWTRGDTVDASTSTTLRVGPGHTVAGLASNADSNGTVAAGSRALNYVSHTGNPATWPGVATVVMAPTP